MGEILVRGDKIPEGNYWDELGLWAGLGSPPTIILTQRVKMLWPHAASAPTTHQPGHKIHYTL
jgi:hypothetical protein